jgi:hypothetical protein
VRTDAAPSRSIASDSLSVVANKPNVAPESLSIAADTHTEAAESLSFASDKPNVACESFSIAADTHTEAVESLSFASDKPNLACESLSIAADTHTEAAESLSFASDKLAGSRGRAEVGLGLASRLKRGEPVAMRTGIDIIDRERFYRFLHLGSAPEPLGSHGRSGGRRRGVVAVFDPIARQAQDLGREQTRDAAGRMVVRRRRKADGHSNRDYAERCREHPAKLHGVSFGESSFLAPGHPMPAQAASAACRSDDSSVNFGFPRSGTAPSAGSARRPAHRRANGHRGRYRRLDS